MLAPGWKRKSRKLDERVAASLATKIEEVRSELEDELAKPAAQELIDHWRRLGGRLPDPI
ncbi:hypothetical protein NWFMUON74_48040 [Nocardia wallacei]|uniref:Uncharacterized protein n=1 Tax=Nocardia wallacei TaxID=480035 RepID=A0A7G1KP59_9NOCA|nr:hypothetical protein NWFMUON74_48040 [Nocardia wallacei]